jgi:hypothetical protein
LETHWGSRLTQSPPEASPYGQLVAAKLDEERSSSDGGALLPKPIDERLGLSKALAGCLRDLRQAGKVAHAKIQLMRQRIFAIALRSLIEQRGSCMMRWLTITGANSHTLAWGKTLFEGV